MVAWRDHLCLHAMSLVVTKPWIPARNNSLLLDGEGRKHRDFGRNIRV